MDSGAHFYRTDFQVHSPRDINWSGDRPVSVADRLSHAELFVKQCREKGVGAVAITDHHDFVFAPLYRTAAASERDSNGDLLPPENRLVVFPGLELTLAVPCQALLLLDADFPSDFLDQVLRALPIEPHDSKADQHGQVKSLDHIQGLDELQQILDQRDWLRGRYIVLPNVTDKGYKTLMRSHMQAKYKNMPCVGGYLDGSIDKKIGEGNKRIFAGLDASWGNKRIAVFETSDSRTADRTDLGKYSTWVKWAIPTAEALRQACLAEESRISHGQPGLPTAYVTRLSVSNSKFLGPIELEMNAQYNAVIGGRGTGKSTILEYLRWGLCDQQAPVDPDDGPDHETKQRRLIDRTLKPFDSHVDVHFVLNGIPHIVRRHASSGEVFLKVGIEEFGLTTEADVRSLLPIHAYSQKQLSGVSVRIDELLRFVTAPIKRDLEQADTSIEESASRFRSNYGNLQRLRVLRRGTRRVELELHSLAQQAEQLRVALGALSDEDQAVLAAKPQHDKSVYVASSWGNGLSQAEVKATAAADDLARLASGIPEVPVNSPDALVLARMRAEAVRVLSEAADHARNAAATVSEARHGGAFAIANAAFQVSQEDFNGQYESVKERSTAHDSVLRELAAIEQRAATAQSALEAQRVQISELGDPETEHRTLRSAWSSLLRERTERLQQQCQTLTSLSEGALRATVQTTNVAAAVERLKGAVGGSGLRTSKFDALLDRLNSKETPASLWELALQELEAVVAADESELDAVSTPILSELGFSAPDVARLRSRFTADGWLDVALTPITDEPTFEYRSKAGEYIPFDIASAGQQATALIRVLLNQPGPPLLIDQPEDDLDSQVIEKIVALIWKAKSQRQLIFSSHSANLVVNGDAELVICCDYRAASDQSGGRIKKEGAIDMPDVRDEITIVMEGGEKAFRLRKDKYGF